ncbi:hypothetical protein RIF29_15278 [Crotalaria pallida]|uniref:Cytochrome P450 n=1 Tax=Crotalaria pallida TaxID=3830 RepID=A0AAN9FJV1_CROPI
MGWSYLGETLKLYTENPNSFFSDRQKWYGDIFKTHVLGCPCVMISSRKAARTVLVTQEHLFKPTYPPSKEKLIGPEALFFHQGAYHSMLKKLVQASFLPSNIRNSVHVVEQIVLKLLPSWTNRTINTLQEMKRARKLLNETIKMLIHRRKESRNFDGGLLGVLMRARGKKAAIIKCLFFVAVLSVSSLLRCPLTALKNVLESLIGTLLNILGKTKDGLNARLDMLVMGIREQLDPQSRGQRTYLPPACHTLSKVEKQSFCECLYSVKVPQGHCSNVKKLVSREDLKLMGLKSHDCHVLMQQLLAVAIRGILPENVRHAITRLCFFFNDICSKVIDPEKLDELENDAAVILCQLEMHMDDSLSNPAPSQDEPVSSSSKRVRGPTRLHRVAKRRAANRRISIPFDPESGRARGPDRAEFNSWCAMEGRTKASILICDWRQVPKNVKNLIWQSIKCTYEVPDDDFIKKKCLQVARDGWKAFKMRLADDYIYGDKKHLSPLDEFDFLEQPVWEKFYEIRTSPDFEVLGYYGGVSFLLMLLYYVFVSALVLSESYSAPLINCGHAPVCSRSTLFAATDAQTGFISQDCRPANP